MRIEAGKFYRTRGGKKALIYCTDAPDGQPIHGRIEGVEGSLEWEADGQYLYEPQEDEWDIVAEWQESIRPGRYKTRGGQVAVVVAVDPEAQCDDKVFGYIVGTGIGTAWRLDGRWSDGFNEKDIMP